jgi:ABC-type transport system involved in multi-copper enzyme maturation permease subunit
MIGFLRPYAATIKDSFREALASRVLWIMLVLISFLLLSIAPLGIRRELTWRVMPGDIDDVHRLAARFVLDAAQDEPSPGKHIWSLLPADLRKRLEQMAGGDADLGELFRLHRELSEGLSEQLKREEFFDRQSWRGVGIGAEARELLDEDVDRLSKNKLARRNRLLLEAAFPDLIRLSGQDSVRMRYLVWDFTPPMPVTAEQLDKGVSMALGAFMQFFVGMIAVFVAILVTASIIPQTLEAGSIELLLSKPISRTLLFLSKFLGGCAFICVNAAYLIGGLWLIVGFRFGIWNHRLLWCIPVFLFLFAVYYSVSALAGVIWRSAIVSVIVTIVFWGTCFLVGVAKNVMEQLVLQPNRINRIVQAGDTLVTVNEMGRASRWDPDTRTWEGILQSGEDPEGAQPFFMMPRLKLGPLYDARNNRLVAVGATTAGGGGFGMGASLWVATPEHQFKRVEGAPVPPGTTELLLEPKGTLIAVSPRGVFRLVGDAEAKPGGVTVLGMELPIPRGEPFVRVGPDPPVAILPPAAVAINQTNGELAVLTRGKLIVLATGADGMFRPRLERELEDADKPSVMAYAGTTILLVQDDGSMRAIDAANLEVRDRLAPEGPNAPRFVEAAPSGTWFVIVFHNGQLHLYDAEQQRLVRRRFTGQGDISAATFVDNRTLLVADRTTRITSYDIVDNQRLKRWAPASTLFERTYRYAILPLYTIYPKPGELDNTVQYVLTNQETIGPMQSDMRQAQVKLNPWAPVWSSALFIVFILAVACVYLWRTDL